MYDSHYEEFYSEFVNYMDGPLNDNYDSGRDDKKRHHKKRHHKKRHDYNEPDYKNFFVYRCKDYDGNYYKYSVYEKLTNYFKNGQPLYKELQKLKSSDININKILSIVAKINHKNIKIDEYILSEKKYNETKDSYEKKKIDLLNLEESIKQEDRINIGKINSIENKLATLDQSISSNNQIINKINTSKLDLLKNSYNISYMENLLMQSYSSIFDAVFGQNSSLNNNSKLRLDNYSVDQSIYLYKLDKIQFYKNINTFLFYLYYICIILFIVIALKYNTQSLLIKLTFFRIFVIILILYPLFILRFEDLFYYFFHNLIYLRFSIDNDNIESKSLNFVSNGQNFSDNLKNFEDMLKNTYNNYYGYFSKLSNYLLNVV